MRKGEIMNNYIDKNFNQLYKKIKEQTLEEVYQTIKDGFDRVSPNIQVSLEQYFKQFPYWGKLDRSKNDYEELYLRSKSLK